MELLIFLNSRGLHCHSLQKMSLEKMWLLESRVISGQQSCRLVGEINGKWSLYVLNYEIDKKMDKNKSCLKFDRQPAITWVTGSKLGPFSSSTANWNIFHSIIRVATAPFLTRHGIYVLFWSVCLSFQTLKGLRPFCLHCSEIYFRDHGAKWWWALKTSWPR